MGEREIHISEEFLKDLLTQDRDVTDVTIKCVKGLPEDAWLYSSRIKVGPSGHEVDGVWHPQNTLVLRYRSEEWEGVDSVLEVMYEQHHDGDVDEIRMPKEVCHAGNAAP